MSQKDGTKKNLQNLDRQLQTNNLRTIPKLGISCQLLALIDRNINNF